MLSSSVAVLLDLLRCNGLELGCLLPAWRGSDDFPGDEEKTLSKSLAQLNDGVNGNGYGDDDDKD